jgi:outer membrane biosynthesis protein TonB
MAVPRPILLTLLGTVLLAATFLATRNARDQAAEAPTPPAAQQAEAPDQAPPPAQEAPKPAEKPGPRADKSQATGRDADKPAPAKERADRSAARKQERAARKAAARRRASIASAAAVKRAIDRNRLVVLFFYQRRSSDDRRVAASVNALRGRSKAAVFQDRIANLSRYGQIATSVGVTRAPSIVIIGKGRRGRLIEGYIDPNTLAQRVADWR